MLLENVTQSNAMQRDEDEDHDHDHVVVYLLLEVE